MERDALVGKVTALLAKAASTEHEPEREAFQAKAQALITRYQIDDAELGDGGLIVERSIAVDGWGNATRGVVHLYAGVAELNRCSVAHRTGRGWSRVVLFGTEVDAELTSALVEHLLPQLRRAILRDQPRSRMSYAIGWAHEVTDRLRAAVDREAATTGALVPTNTVADDALRSAHTVRNERRSELDSMAYGDGAVAAGDADLGHERVGPAERPEVDGPAT